MKQVAGTPAYMAPEVLQFYREESEGSSNAASVAVTSPAAQSMMMHYDAKVDVWSYGMVLWALFTEQKPFEEVNKYNLPQHAEKLCKEEQYRPAIPQAWSKDPKLTVIEKLVRRCWIGKEPYQRPSFKEIVETLEVGWSSSNSSVTIHRLVPLPF